MGVVGPFKKDHPEQEFQSSCVFFLLFAQLFIKRIKGSATTARLTRAMCSRSFLINHVNKSKL